MTEENELTVVKVGLEERSYPIFIKKGLLPDIGADLKEKNIAKRFAVISDEHVAGLYGDTLMTSLAEAGLDAELITFPPGEKSKNLETILTLCRELASRNFDRQDGLIALGGGVPGDITGFVASIYLRGISFIQIPTTLLAQVDSSVGGKTGVDIPEGKNLVGTFYQPKAVYIDTEVLQSLPADELLGGLAEVIKYGVILDADLFAFLERQREEILQLGDQVIPSLISRCCEIKAWVVEQDEREGDLRRILNFGHTIGHAVEAASDFTLIHGLAVAIGMRTAADLAVRSNLLEHTDAVRLTKLISAYGMPIDIPADMDRQRIKGFLKTDKKTIGGRVFFVLPTKIGEVAVTDKIAEADIDAVLS